MPVPLSPRRSTARLAAGFSLVTLVLITACTPAQTPRTETPPPSRIVAEPLDGRTGARLIVADAASRIEVRLTRLPGRLYQISTPAGSGLAPGVTGVAGRLRLALRPTGDDGPDVVTVLLNRAVRWDIRLPAGAGEQHLDLSAGSVTRVDLGTAGLAELRLPRPSGTVPIRITGGVGAATVSAAGPLRITLGQGAGSVVAPWTTNNGSAPGTVLMGPGWTITPHRYAVHARAGLGMLTVDQR